MRARHTSGPTSEALHHAGTEALDQRVGPLDETQEHLGRVRMLQVDRDRPAAAVHRVEPRIDAVAPLATSFARRGRPVDPNDLGSHVRQHHRREGSGPEPGHLDHPEPFQRSHALVLSRPRVTAAATACHRRRNPGSPIHSLAGP